MYFSSIEHKLKTTKPISKVLTFLNQDFSNLNFDTLLFTFFALLLKFIFVLKIGEGLAKQVFCTVS